MPGLIISIASNNSAEVDFGGVIRSVQLDLVPAARSGDYVIVHAGYAIEKLSKTEALETLDVIKEAFGS